MCVPAVGLGLVRALRCGRCACVCVPLMSGFVLRCLWGFGLLCLCNMSPLPLYECSSASRRSAGGLSSPQFLPPAEEAAPAPSPAPAPRATALESLLTKVCLASAATGATASWDDHLWEQLRGVRAPFPPSWSRWALPPLLSRWGCVRPSPAPDPLGLRAL